MLCFCVVVYFSTEAFQAAEREARAYQRSLRQEGASLFQDDWEGGWDNLSEKDERDEGSSTDTAPSFSELDAASVLIDLTSGGSGGGVLTEEEGEEETREGEGETIERGRGRQQGGMGMARVLLGTFTWGLFCPTLTRTPSSSIEPFCLLLFSCT